MISKMNRYRNFTNVRQIRGNSLDAAKNTATSLSDRGRLMCTVPSFVLQSLHLTCNHVLWPQPRAICHLPVII